MTAPSSPAGDGSGVLSGGGPGVQVGAGLVGPISLDADPVAGENARPSVMKVTAITTKNNGLHLFMVTLLTPRQFRTSNGIKTISRMGMVNVWVILLTLFVAVTTAV